MKFIMRVVTKAGSWQSPFLMQKLGFLVFHGKVGSKHSVASGRNRINDLTALWMTEAANHVGHSRQL